MEELRGWAVAFVPAGATVVAVLLVVLLTASRASRGASRRARHRLPPGPRGWPILGSLPSLGTLPHQSLYDLAKKYGPLMYLHLGSVPTVVVTSPKMAEAILKTNDLIMASRPFQIVGQMLSYEARDILMSPYGHHWRYLRKVCMSGLLTPYRMRQFQKVRRREVLDCLHFILEESERGNAVCIIDCLSALGVNNMTQMMVNKSYCVQKSGSNLKPAVRTISKSFQEIYQEMFELTGGFNIADYVPLLKPLDPQGYHKRAKDVLRRMDGFWEMIIEEHRQRLLAGTPENYTEDFVDVLLGLGHTKDFQESLSVESIKGLMGDLLAGAADTTAVTAQWMLTEMMRQPQVMRRAQEELDSVVGPHRLVQEEDLPELKYLSAVIKETLRLHPAGPLMAPHESTHDCEIEGFHIPARTRVFVNVWAIHRDPAFWDRPLVFDPDRFLNSNLDFKGQSFHFFPFGSGRRICPGSSYGVLAVTNVMAVLLHALDWAPSNGQEPQELDTAEKFGLVLYKKVPLAVFGKARLPAHVIYPAQELQ